MAWVEDVGGWLAYDHFACSLEPAVLATQHVPGCQIEGDADECRGDFGEELDNTCCAGISRGEEQFNKVG